MSILSGELRQLATLVSIHRAPLRHLGVVLLALSLAFGLSACSPDAAARMGKGKTEDSKGKEKDEEKEELVPVEVATLEKGPIEAILRFSTNLEAEGEVQVFSQATRLIKELLVEEGASVRKGQTLIRLEDDAQRITLARTESQLEKAEREFARQQNLFSKELISEKAMNDATYEVEQLKLAIQDARRDLSYTEVVAPISGTITQRMVNLGDNIQINQHLFDIVDFDTIVARIYVPERQLSNLRVGQSARVFSGSLEGGPRTGQVLRIAPIVDPRSGTVKVTLGIPSNQGLLPGMYVEVELVIDQRQDALLVPKRALIYDDTQIFVYRLTDEMKAERLLVKPLVEDSDHIEPVSGGPRGLAAGDRVVIAGQAGLKDGLKVRLAETDRGVLKSESSL